MLDISDAILWGAARVEGLSVVVTYAARLESNDIAFLYRRGQLVANFTPHSDRDTRVGVVGNHDVESVFVVTCFELD